MQERVPTIAVIGAGLRSSVYASEATGTSMARIVAVAEPDPARREAFRVRHGIPEEGLFEDWRDLLAQERLADAVIIGTQDHLHLDPAVAAAERGYHILLEKPIAPTEEAATRIVEAAERNGVILAVCHVMRYSPYTQHLLRLIREGAIGRVVDIQHLEQVGWWHFAHSFVRGNWRREDESTTMLLAKACHDIDWVSYMMGRIPTRVSSFGSLNHFRAEERPEGAADRCWECPVRASCPYSARRIYLDCLGDPEKEFWPLSAVTTDATEAGVEKALREGPYGRCVYASDNDVVDTQVVSMEFDDGATATVTVTAFAALEHRKTRLFGTRGSIEGDGRMLRIHDFTTDTITEVDTGLGDDASMAGGHGGADGELARAFFAAIRDGDPTKVLTSGHDSLDTHRVVWAAEDSRRDGVVVTIP
ncbi:MAG: Gfo/Idh/MocA family oxidoreductase [Microbacterium sp.]|jgi:predicted dehydrogenase|uniref:Gfo/Idh/MocA family protein n=1 Tax=Microbacterium sp. TaxID=51671 RepID=UPI00282F4D13|nr:Gfo/Idh/MocA family oxidoreductase [Microbacterium sp.]MDR2322063.1 Gfo/Idh/MocA family oxidoreductase [Microbacterium sp.]